MICYANDIEYVLDRAELYELDILVEKFNKENLEAWERTRLSSYVFAQTQAKKKYKPTDIIKFPWDEEESDRPVERFEDVMERMKSFQQRIEESKNNKPQIAKFN